MKFIPYIIGLILLVFFTTLATDAYRETEPPPQPASINGINFTAPPRAPSSNPMPSVVEAGAGWVSVIPYAFAQKDHPIVTPNTGGWWGETKDGCVQTIKYAQEHQLKIMLKPHVWVRGDGWCGDFKLSNEADWKTWEQSYENYLMPLVKEAAAMNVEMICIATEYRQAVKQRPQYWRNLIKKIRKIYPGKLTYAANWDNYEYVTFWDELDYIGIDAYFPLVDDKDPTVKEMVKGWTPWKKKITQFQRKWNKPIIFTEYGYRSVDYGVRRPWESGAMGPVNMELQDRAYEAFFQTFWNESWFEGGFLWKWYTYEGRNKSRRMADFTPQNKPAMETIKRWYSQ